MNSKGFGRRGWLIQLVAAIGLVVVMSGVAAAWDITATSITNSSGKTGRIYFSVMNQYNNGVAGGSLPSGATTGTIHGVPSGSYTLNVFIDTQGTGFQHANDPSLSFPITVAGNSGGDLVFTAPVSVAVVAPAKPQPMPLDKAVFINFKPDTVNNLPIADKHIELNCKFPIY